MSMDLTKNEFAKLCGIGSKTVNQWVCEGMPKRMAVVNNRKRVMINREKAATWLWSKRRYKYAKMMTMPGDFVPVKTKQTKATASPHDSIAQARQLVDDAFRMYQTAPTQEKSFCMELYTKLSDNLRKLEKDNPEIQLSKGEVMLRADVERTLAEMSTAIKNDLCAVPDKLAGLLEGLTAGEIQLKLREAIEDALRHLGNQ